MFLLLIKIITIQATNLRHFLYNKTNIEIQSPIINFKTQIQNFGENKDLRRNLDAIEPSSISSFYSLNSFTEECNECGPCSSDTVIEKAADGLANTKFCGECKDNYLCQNNGELYVHYFRQYSSHIPMVQYKVTSAADHPTRDPIRLIIYTTYDWETWYTASNFVYPTWKERGETLTFDITNSGSYPIYSLVMIKRKDADGDMVQIADYELVPGCSSNADCALNEEVEFCTQSASTCNTFTGRCEITSKAPKITGDGEVICPSVGETFPAIAIRVIATDSETTSTKEEIHSYLFGTDAAQATLSSQFSACSRNQFNIVPYSGTTSTGVVITNGVVDISLDQNVQGLTSHSVEHAVITQANGVLGDLESQFSFVMLCLPPGTVIGASQYWKAYAYLYSYLSVYNDENCNYVSVQMHEIGHNLGLAHSNDHANYGDESGMMGISYSTINGPKKCFNGVKSWQLGWFEDAHFVVNLKQLIKWEYYQYMVRGLSHYSSTNTYPVIYKLINSDDGYEYYISYNTDTDMNSGTGEGNNKIMITRRSAGSSYDDSFVFGLLDIDTPTIIYMIEDGVDLVIYRDVNPSESVGLFVLHKSNLLCTEDSDCEDNDSCTVDSCNTDNWRILKACSHVSKDCSECGYPVTVQVNTNEHPKHIVWDVTNLKSGTITSASGELSLLNHLYDKSKCLEYGRYMFKISYSNNDTTATPFDYKLLVGDVLMDNDTIVQEGLMESYFIICASDDECLDYNGCTIDYCDTETRLCRNSEELAENCENCSWFTFNITLDNYPDETLWRLSDKIIDNTVISGEPYSIEFNSAFGRRKAPTKSGRRKAPTKSGRRKATINDSLFRQNDRFLSNVDENTLNNNICLEIGYIYYFYISDSFGDGICCSEGNGNYVISTGDQTLQQGGEFSYEEALTFKPIACLNNADCFDSDPATKDVCFSTVSVCVYYQNPCDDYGSLVNFTIATSPELISWQIFSNGTQIMSGGPFTNLYATHEDVHCFSYGTYEVMMYDSNSRISIYCSSDPNCGYVLSVNDTIVSESNKLIANDKRAHFGTCIEDLHCNDYNPCTEDTCEYDSKTCIFTPLPCSECSSDPCDVSSVCVPSPCSVCGKRNLVVEISTDGMPQDSQWNVTDKGNGMCVLSGDTYYQTFHKYVHGICVGDGVYIMTMTDIGRNGFFCLDPAACGYKVSLDDELIHEGQHFQYEEIFEFTVVGPSISPSKAASVSPSLSLLPSSFPSSKFPSLSPSSIPSETPSGSPSLEPSVVASGVPSMFDDNWTLTFADVRKSVSLTDKLFLDYRISKVVSDDQFVASVYYEDCVTKSMEDSIMVTKTNIQETSVTELNNVTAIVKFNESTIEYSNYWKNSSEGVGVISFCLKSEIMLPDGSDSISYTDAIVHTYIKLESGFSTFQITLTGKDLMKVEKENEMEVFACICNDLLLCESSPLLEPNAFFKICIYPSNQETIIAKINNVAIFQDGIAKSLPVVESIPDSITSIEIGETGIIETRLKTKFFSTINPSNINVEGKVTVDLKKRRVLFDQKVKGVDQIPFRLSVGLKKPTELKRIGITALTCFVFILWIIQIKLKKPKFAYSAINNT